MRLASSFVSVLCPSWIALACLAGCDTSLVVGEATQAICTGSGCPDNSPVIAGVPFYELERNGEPNEQGFQVTGLWSANRLDWYQIDVQNARLVGLDADGNVALDTQQMDHAIIEVVDQNGNVYDLTIIELSAIQFWSDPSDWVTTYLIEVSGPDVTDPELCPNHPDPGDEWPGNLLNAFFFEGDRYSPQDKEVVAIGPETTGWFNVVCAGSAPAKLHLTRYTEAGAHQDIPTTRLERQAMLRAFTATACPGSNSFTGVGENLYILDRNGLTPREWIDWSRVEAVWDENGIVCRGREHRLDDPDSMSPTQARQVLAPLSTQCPNLPSCGGTIGLPFDWKSRGMAITSNW